MLKEIGAALQWYAMLGARFFQVFPLGTSTAIALTFLAQLALIASFLLPLKIVMIMSNGNIPNIFPPAINQLGEHVLIIAITAVAIGAFLFHSVATKTIENLAAKGAQKVQQHADKLALFENQDNLAQTAILKFTSALASFLFITVGLTIIAVLYWELVAVTAAFVVASIAVYALIWAKAPNWWSAIANQFPKHMNTLSNIGFLALFLTIVIDYMVAAIPGFLVVLLSIILSRQLFSQMAMGVNGIHFLNTHQPKLKAIAFEDHAFSHSAAEQHSGVWGFLTDQKYKDELMSRICEIAESEQNAMSLNWMDTGLPNILHLTAEPETDHQQKYLIKIFDKNKSAKARHEATLLLGAPEDLPSPKLLAATTIGQTFHLHIFDISGYGPYHPPKHKEGMKKFELELMGVKPPEELVHQYQRSRPMLWDRINHTLLKRTLSVATEAEKAVAEEFMVALPTLKHELQTLPLSIQNPVRNPSVFLVDDQNTLVSTHWTEWTLDPAGANTANLKEGDSTQLEPDQNQAQLASLLSDFEKNASRQHYRLALGAILSIVEMIRSG